MRTIIGAIAAAVLCASDAAWADGCSQPDLGPDIFCGTYREGPKTSFVNDGNGAFATPQAYGGLTGLLATLPSDDIVRNSGVDFSLHRAPSIRLGIEQHNVDVLAYVVAVKPGEGDHDFHVIISDGQLGKGTVFMNVEVASRPQRGRRRRLHSCAERNRGGRAGSSRPLGRIHQDHGRAPGAGPGLPLLRRGSRGRLPPRVPGPLVCQANVGVGNPPSLQHHRSACRADQLSPRIDRSRFAQGTRNPSRPR